ncbi:sugar phosphate isomerase/epimerase family protein [Ascidiimonas sp. W6]|uniref:sugar phosphate isomerase/epimerase family protein n=1 Tax=Ascidiimonas meishanensis TaxID=3128903 RepID=UPI0030ED615F
MHRRNFIWNTAQATFALSLLGLASCKKEQNNKEETQKDAIPNTSHASFFKLSLAQWSIHKMILDGGLSPFEFAAKAKNWGFEGLEYVNHLYSKELEKNTNSAMAMDNLVKELKKRSEDNGLENLIIMIDGQGDFGFPDEASRIQAVENHYKWVDAAAALGCHSIRVNLFGSKDAEVWKAASIDALNRLSEYSVKSNINVLVENHGWLSSNAKLLVEVMQEVNKPNCGTLPDFGNFCLEREGGERWQAPCVKEYDKYLGVKELMPFAKAVSAKSYDFDENGNETTIDYVKMLQIVKNAGYNGYIGVEYEGSRLNEEMGIIATKDLLIKASKAIK